MRVFPRKKDKESKFIEKINEDKVSVVFVGAEFLANNSNQRDFFEASRTSFEESLINFFELDITRDPDLEYANELDARALPTIIILRNGMIEQSLVGLSSESLITDTINTYI